MHALQRNVLFVNFIPVKLLSDFFLIIFCSTQIWTADVVIDTGMREKAWIPVGTLTY